LRSAIALLPGLLMLASLAACDRQKAAAPQGEAPPTAAPAPAGVQSGLDRSRAGTPAPAVSFQDPQGRPTTLAAFRGRPVLVNLWATWCAPCIVEMPSLDRLAARGGNLQVLALSQDLEGRAKVDAFFQEQGYRTLRPYLDQDMAFMTAIGAGTLPVTILYDAQGREVWRKIGIAEWDGTKAAGWLNGFAGDVGSQ